MRDVPVPPPTVIVSRAARPAPRRPADVDWTTSNKFLNGPFAPWQEETAAFDLR